MALGWSEVAAGITQPVEVAVVGREIWGEHCEDELLFTASFNLECSHDAQCPGLGHDERPQCSDDGLDDRPPLPTVFCKR